MPKERELKFSTTDDHLPSGPELEPAMAAAGLALGPAHRMVLKDRYYDDARLSLMRAGLALRRRLGEGEALATLKTRGTVAGALHDRDEIELPLHGQGWPRAIEDRIAVVTAPALLRPHTEIETERVRHAVLREGRVIALLAFDSVSAKLQHGERQAHFNEVEIEAHGDTSEEDLDRIAQAVATLMPLTASGATKLERAQALLQLSDW